MKIKFLKVVNLSFDESELKIVFLMIKKEKGRN